MSVEQFYDELAPSYAALFADFDASCDRQGQQLWDCFIPSVIPEPHTPNSDGGKSADSHHAGAAREDRGLIVLDAACGIGTQSVGLVRKAPSPTAMQKLVCADLSAAAVGEAERRVTQTVREGTAALSTAFTRADLRTLSADLPADVVGKCDVILAMDNVLPHLLELAELDTALAQVFATLRPGGRFVGSTRDYDAIEPHERTTDVFPSVQSTRRLSEPDRLVFQLWDWVTPDVYRVHQFVHPANGEGVSTAVTTTYRAYTRQELTEAFVRAGFTGVTWHHEPYYQPVVTAERPLL